MLLCHFQDGIFRAHENKMAVFLSQFGRSYGSSFIFNINFIFLSLFIYLFWERERGRPWEGEGQRERGKERISIRLCTVSAELNVRLKLGTCEIMTWAGTKSWPFNQLSHPGTTLVSVFKTGVPGCLSQLSIQLRLRSWSHCEFKPHVGLCADSSEPGVCFRLCVFLSLCPFPTHALSLKNKHKTLKNK